MDEDSSTVQDDGKAAAAAASELAARVSGLPEVELYLYLLLLIYLIDKQRHTQVRADMRSWCGNVGGGVRAEEGGGETGYACYMSDY
jgi:hypothetical protein